MKTRIRLANGKDVSHMLVIYAPIVRETAISFELEPPSEKEFQQRIERYQQQMPWLVCEINSEVVGYAYASLYRTRAAYQSVHLFLYQK
ncbi:GNAT family N-acetyltransferase [Scytonema sp. UIC 10036]|uniref:GNAT family N-acetyltransferase n=1 Tax=Scytonema sp. UIC 10036 TaxID=2304196 RepID=UPI001FAAF0C6|nr:GNAT family N-acetyltransferase [Scytonema sp. UIC 10036]